MADPQMTAGGPIGRATNPGRRATLQPQMNTDGQKDGDSVTDKRIDAALVPPVGGHLRANTSACIAGDQIRAVCAFRTSSKLHQRSATLGGSPDDVTADESRGCMAAGAMRGTTLWLCSIGSARNPAGSTRIL
jgi:hypothetical protein